ncbi:hypothetical protein [Marinobacter flavimaris]|uniref:hypothetical protein n=1 Tax=Marinobacter flavimaris TaxID=262076 RepID=UPI0038703597
MRLIVAMFCFVVMAGCSSVVIKEPFPDTRLSAEEQARIAGTWLLDEQELVYVRFNSKGTPWVVRVVWEDDEFHLVKRRLYFSKRDDTLYVSTLAYPDQPGEYLFGEIKLHRGEAYVWGPEIDFFTRQVESEAIEGTVDEDKFTVSLETPAAAILELISLNDRAIDYKSPLVFRKLKE